MCTACHSTRLGREGSHSTPQSCGVDSAGAADSVDSGAHVTLTFADGTRGAYLSSNGFWDTMYADLTGSNSRYALTSYARYTRLP